MSGSSESSDGSPAASARPPKRAKSGRSRDGAPAERREAEAASRNEVFELMAGHGHEQLVFWSEPSIGYRGIIAVHDTTLGPALGGTRFWSYGSEHEAVVDALRLSRAMTYKAAVAGLELGGGKAVIIRDGGAPDREELESADREMLFRAHGRAIESLNGRYITAEDVGTTVQDMEYIHLETDHVTGIVDGSGDPSPLTAYGVYRGMKACARVRYGDESLEGRHVAVQGVGHVGYYLSRHLVEEGARLTVTDLDEKRAARVVEELGAERVEPDEIYGVDADVFAPCALGAVVDDDTIDALRVDIVAGGANNQLAEERHGAELEERDILYAPDYVVNAGGICSVYGELAGWSPERARRKAGEVHDTLLRVFARARRDGVPPGEAADRLAEQRLARVRELHRTRV